MRILIDATAAFPGGGGLNTYLCHLLYAWRNAGPQDHIVSVVTRDCDPAVLTAARETGHVEQVGGRSPLARIASQQIAMPYLLRKHSCDVLLASTPVEPIVMNVPAVAVVHDMRYLTRPDEFKTLQGGYRRIMYYRAYQRSDRLVAISQTTASALKAACPEAASKTVVVYHGADHVDSWPQAPKARQALAFGHWANKRPDLAIRVWAQLKRTIDGFDWLLNVVGTRHNERPHLKALAADLGVAEITRIHPFLPERQFQELFSASELVLFPTTDEGFGLPIVEAMRLGIPVVTSDIGATREVGGDCALYAGNGSMDQFAERCRDIFTSPERRDQLIASGLERASTFLWSRTAQQTRDVLLSTLKVPAAPRLAA